MTGKSAVVVVSLLYVALSVLQWRNEFCNNHILVADGMAAEQ